MPARKKLSQLKANKLRREGAAVSNEGTGSAAFTT
jgi:hypothetical protein